MLLSALLAGFEARWLCRGDAELRSISVDERELGPGALYIAQPGYYGDGHDRIDAALAAGASALLVRDPERVPEHVSVPVACIGPGVGLLGKLAARFYGEPTRQLTTYGVTGTNGKTSVTYLLEHMLRALGERVAVMGTVSYRFGSFEHPATNTTPDALFVQRFARQALDAGASCLVLEVSSHALVLGRTSGVCFDRVGFTNLSHEHLDFHGDLASYRAAKQLLFGPLLLDALRAGKQPLAVACTDGADGEAMLAAAPPEVSRLAVSARGPDAAVDVCCSSLGPDGSGGTRVSVRTPCGEWTGTMPLFGDYNRANVVLAAAMVAGTDPARWAVAVSSLPSFGGVPGRLELAVPLTSAPHGIFVDYAHTPDALARALGVLREAARGPVTVVVGAGGDRDGSKRPLMGRAAQLGAERVILTSDNPRSEPPERIVAEMAAGTQAADGDVCCVTDRSEAIDLALSGPLTGPVLVAGKGHERYQERHGIRHPLDDREEIRRALAARQLACRAADAPLVDGWSAARIVAATGGGLDQPVQAARRWIQAIVDEARLRYGGLLVLVAHAGTAAQRARLLERLAASLGGARPLVAEVGSSGLLALAQTVGCIAPAHRALVAWPTEAASFERLAGVLAVLAPDLVVSKLASTTRECRTASERRPLGTSAASEEPLPRTLSWARALALAPAEWSALRQAASEHARRRLRSADQERPIPVPEGLLTRGAR